MTPGVYFKFGPEECGRKNNQVVTFYWGGACKGYACSSVLTHQGSTCLLYTSDAADDLLCVDLGGRRIIKKKSCTSEFELKQQ